jgi:DNA-directed RNA polymerase specialized sigma24 family protein
VFFYFRKGKRVKENHDRQIRRALKMYEFGYSCIEIADVMGISESNVRCLLQEKEKAA